MTDDEKEIRRIIGRWHDATAEGNVEAVLELMSEDVVFLVPGQEPMRGRQAFADGLRSVLRTHRIQSSGVVQEVVVCDDIAYSWTRLKVSASPRVGGEATLREGNTLSIFRREANGAWVLARDANLLTPLNPR